MSVSIVILGAHVDALLRRSVLEHSRACITEEEICVFDSVRDLQRLASSLVWNQVIAPTTSWNEALDEVTYKGYRLKMANLTGGVKKMQADLFKKMYNLSGGTPVQYIIPEGHVDDLTSTGRGESWLQGCRTETRDQGLMEAMCKAGSWNLSTVGAEGLIWNLPACRGFMERVADIVDLMATLNHIGSGPPLRGEELIRDQISNGIQPRTIYLSCGRILAIRRHSKTTNSKGMDPFNVCYFPGGLTEAMCYYLLVIRPLEKVVAWQLYNDERKCLQYDQYLYVKRGERITSVQFSAALSKLTGKYLGVSLTIQPLRQIMVEFKRSYVEESMTGAGDDIGDIISSHSSKSAKHLYARGIGVPSGETTNTLLDTRDWCKLYHNAIGLGDRLGPLVPLRVKRDLIKKLASLSSMEPGDHAVTGIVTDTLKVLGVAAYKSAIEDVKSSVVKEVWEAVAHGIELVTSDGDFQPRPHTARVSSRREQLAKQPPPRPPPPSPPRTIPVTKAPPSRKHQLSEKQEPAWKRQDFGVPPSEGTPQYEEPTHAYIDTALPVNDASYSYGDPTMEPTVGRPIIRLPTRKLGVDITSYTLPQSLSRMSLEANPQVGTLKPVPQGSTPEPEPYDKTPEPCPRGKPLAPSPEDEDFERSPEANQPCAPSPNTLVHHRTAGTTPAPRLQDDLLGRLRDFRRDQSAEFKSIFQRELLAAAIAGGYTLAVIPTGGGKSAAFEIPPSFQRQITVVAFPYRVILCQALEIARRNGTAAEVWTVNTERNADNVKLILVQYETLIAKGFIE